ncbi:hypothetical protein [Ruegeria lacuscaerulensis]|uniref:hypothetical protein n=1 Tax=Ruegeria lacuscaerulensis TaxID=55218 RepID=UPI00147D8D22|nr:hypothetical protein [Ruegeria lacuscaerulensis]
MSYLRPFATKCAVAVFAAQLFAFPAIADNISVSSGSFIFINSKSLSLHYRSTHRVNRYYHAPRVYHYNAKPKAYYYTKPKAYYYNAKPKGYYHKAKPKVHYVKPVKRHYRSSPGHFNRLSSPYYIPQRYGIQHRNFRRGFSRHNY